MRKHLSFFVTAILLAVLFSGVLFLWKIENQTRQKEVEEKTTSILTLLTREVEEYTKEKINLLQKLKENWKAGTILSETELYGRVKTNFSLWSGFKAIELLNTDGTTLWHVGPPQRTLVSPALEKYLIDYATTTERLAVGAPIGPQKDVVLYLALPSDRSLNKQPKIMKAVLDSEMLIRKIFSQAVLKEYFLYFLDNDQIFYQNPPFSVDAEKAMSSIESQVTVGNRRWTVGMAPVSREVFGHSLAFYALAPLVLGLALWIGTLVHVQKNLQIKNKRERERLLQALELIPQMFCELDKTLKVRYANSHFLKMFNLTEDHFLGGYDFTLLFTPEERFSNRKLLTQLLSAGQTHSATFEVQKPNATTFPCEIVFAPAKNEVGNLIGFYTLLSDISEKQKIERHIKQLTYYDELTGLPNQTLFKELMSQEIARYPRSRQPIALLLIDIDRFKLVNDAVGHLGGDVLLKTITERLMSYLRQGDTLARLRGDEFAFILSNSARNEQNFDITHSAQVVARKILTHLTKPFLFEGREIFMSGNIGIALYPQDAEDTDTLMQAADTALSMSQVKGKNNYQFYFAEQNVAAARRLEAEKQLRYALKKQEFELRYHPKYNLRTEKICGVEALLSWKSKEKGVLLPAEFLSFAEENGLIVPIGKWVLKTACFQLQSWMKMGFNLRMAVNFSIRQIQEDTFLRDVLEILQETSIAPHLLEFEITDAILMSEKLDATKVLQSIQNLGVKLVLDDFGKGYSALGLLRSSPVSQIKIDREFITQIPQNLQNKELVEGLVAFAHHLSLGVTAEGVETNEQYEFLKQINCDAAQGYYLSKPLRAEEVEKLLISVS